MVSPLPSKAMKAMEAMKVFGAPLDYLAVFPLARSAYDFSSRLFTAAAKVAIPCMRRYKRVEHALLVRQDRLGEATRVVKTALMMAPALRDTLVASSRTFSVHAWCGLYEGLRASYGYIPGISVGLPRLFNEESRWQFVSYLVGTLFKGGAFALQLQSEMMVEQEITQAHAVLIEPGIKRVVSMLVSEVGSFFSETKLKTCTALIVATEGTGRVAGRLHPSFAGHSVITRAFQLGLVRGSLVILAGNYAGAAAGVATAFTFGILNRSAAAWSRVWRDPYLQSAYMRNKEEVLRGIIEREALSQMVTSEKQTVFTDEGLGLVDAYLR